MAEIIKNVEIEDIVCARLDEYEGRNGKIKSYTIPVEDIILDAGLNIEYENIAEGPGEMFLAGLDLATKSVIINAKHSKLFKDKPGLERSSMAHELGHWDVFERHKMTASEEPTIFCDSEPEVLFRSTESKRKCLVLDLWQDDDVYNVIKKYDKKRDHPYVASAVDRYANFLLLPKEKVMEYSEGVDLTVWSNLYEMAERFEVTISALTVRLKRLDMIYIKDKVLYESKDAALGQGTLF